MPQRQRTSDPRTSTGRRRRRLAAAAAALAVLTPLGIAAATATAPSALAAPGDRGSVWSTVTTASVTSAPGFPSAAVTSDAALSVASSATITGSTPPGIAYGTSSGATYLSVPPLADGSASTTTISFAQPTPAAAWSIVVGDVDSESVGITAFGADGAALPAAALGFAGVFSYAPGGADLPVWDGSGGLSGNGPDTSGASAWFSPTAPISRLELTSTALRGSPTLQLWLVAATAELSGVVTGATGPLAGAAVTLSDAGGVPLPGVAPLSTAADGAYATSIVPQPVTITAVDPATGAAATVSAAPTGTAPGALVFADPVTLALAAPAGPAPVAPAPPAAVAPAAAERRELAATGATVAPAAAAVGLLAGGALLAALGIRRRRSTPHPH
jgi:hypothetical protein